MLSLNCCSLLVSYCVKVSRNARGYFYITELAFITCFLIIVVKRQFWAVRVIDGHGEPHSVCISVLDEALLKVNTP